MAGALVLAGCSSAPEPAPFSADVVWPDGEPVGELEESPWVQAVREYELVVAAGTNALDFSSSRFGIMKESVAQGWYEAAVDGIEDGDLELWVGPRSFAVTSVVETETGATVVVCLAPRERIMVEPQETLSTAIEYYLVEVEGRRVVDGAREERFGSCDATGAVQGLFVTPPDRELLTIDDPSVVVPPRP
ncbi:hypothetical protein H9623_15460 [Oerskovia sp. Sa1BUA8]|uniref:Uncharacterized protein n=2 Tax=Oerskovia TaxID=162491 RepID=A0A9D5UBX8_9CELL|nr:MULTISPECIES: hypothetical protein [Oerskovia]MBD7982391.1 hypothetical protein [Oerskovia merdavium]MBE7701690.1 hypothetical protein [Oerskovia douganii]